MPKLVKHNNVWCIQASFTIFDKPERVIQHWPIGRAGRWIDFEAYDGYPVASGGCNYIYTIKIAPYDHVRLCLKNEGQTQSIDTIIEPVPCPKVRKGVETRWMNGKWEKYLKSQGWVSI